jgi:hypothetical protein
MRMYIHEIGSTPALPSGAAERDAEGLVQVQVAHVAAEFAGRRHADEGVHVGAIDVHAAAVLVHQRAEFLHFRVEHAIRARVGDHDRGEFVAVGIDLRREVIHIDVAQGIALDDDDAHARHLRARRIGAVR